MITIWLPIYAIILIHFNEGWDAIENKQKLEETTKKKEAERKSKILKFNPDAFETDENPFSFVKATVQNQNITDDILDDISKYL